MANKTARCEWSFPVIALPHSITRMYRQRLPSPGYVVATDGEECPAWEARA